MPVVIIKTFRMTTHKSSLFDTAAYICICLWLWVVGGDLVGDQSWNAI